MFKHCYTYKRGHRLGQINYVCCYLMLFVSGTHILRNRSSRTKVLYKKGTPRNSAKTHRKTPAPENPFQRRRNLCWSLFLIWFTKKRLQYRFFSVKFSKILRTPILKNVHLWTTVSENTLFFYKHKLISTLKLRCLKK